MCTKTLSLSSTEEWRQQFWHSAVRESSEEELETRALEIDGKSELIERDIAYQPLNVFFWASSI